MWNGKCKPTAMDQVVTKTELSTEIMPNVNMGTRRRLFNQGRKRERTWIPKKFYSRTQSFSDHNARSDQHRHRAVKKFSPIFHRTRESQFGKLISWQVTANTTPLLPSKANFPKYFPHFTLAKVAKRILSAPFSSAAMSHQSYLSVLFRGSITREETFRPANALVELLIWLSTGKFCIPIVSVRREKRTMMMTVRKKKISE